MNIQHVEASQTVFDTANSPPQYYLNPLGIISCNMGAKEFDSAMSMRLDTPTQFTINVTMSPGSGTGSLIMPLAQGMAFTTGIYSSLTPLLQTVGHAILSFQKVDIGKGTKYKVGLNDGTTWLVYIFPSSGKGPVLVQDGATLLGDGQLTGYIQIAKIPTDNASCEATYDAQAGTYVTSVHLCGSTFGAEGTYGYKFTVGGIPSNSVLHFAFPHHRDSFDADTQKTATDIYLQSTTMGRMRAYAALTWVMLEQLPYDVVFLSGGTEASALSADAIAKIRNAAEADIGIDISSDTQLDSQYFAGKALAKYAGVCLVANDILEDPALTAAGVGKLKAAFEVFVNNQQPVPLCYDNTWKGLVSTGGFSNPGADFGNTYYNDHHYHYGYFIYSAAVLGHIDPTWLTRTNVDYINCLVRDVSNPSDQDPYFPVDRSFDWFVGHSWSKGIFFSADGKDEESSSEDYNFAYGMKLWGLVTNNTVLQARGNLMLAIQRR
jgi:endo-1,3(4)-beta-glucanase